MMKNILNRPPGIRVKKEEPKTKSLGAELLPFSLPIASGNKKF
jgi:hypothetical protein